MAGFGFTTKLETPSRGYLPPTRDASCANCEARGEDKRLFVCRDCYAAGRHKVPEVFQCRFCSESCWETAMLKSHRLLHQHMSEEQLEQIQHPNPLA
ncbi:unnamed protein product, partial [Mesorhabditis spiculigera]